MSSITNEIEQCDANIEASSMKFHVGTVNTDGSFHVKSPNGLNPTLLEFHELWHTC